MIHNHDNYCLIMCASLKKQLLNYISGVKRGLPSHIFKITVSKVMLCYLNGSYNNSSLRLLRYQVYLLGHGTHLLWFVC